MEASKNIDRKVYSDFKLLSERPYHLFLQLPGCPYTPNSLRGSFWKYYRHKKDWLAKITQFRRKFIPETPLIKAEIIFTRWSTGKTDYDNNVASFKPVLDCLKDVGIILNDSPDHVVTSYFHKKAKAKHITIEVKEI